MTNSDEKTSAAQTVPPISRELVKWICEQYPRLVPDPRDTTTAQLWEDAGREKLIARLAAECAIQEGGERPAAAPAANVRDWILDRSRRRA